MAKTTSEQSSSQRSSEGFCQSASPEYHNNGIKDCLQNILKNILRLKHILEHQNISVFSRTRSQIQIYLQSATYLNEMIQNQRRQQWALLLFTFTQRILWQIKMIDMRAHVISTRKLEHSGVSSIVYDYQALRIQQVTLHSV